MARHSDKLPKVYFGHLGRQMIHETTVRGDRWLLHVSQVGIIAEF
jgi:hypothetical protein